MMTTSVRWTLTFERRLADVLQQMRRQRFEDFIVVVVVVDERLQRRTASVSRLPTNSASHGGDVLLHIPHARRASVTQQFKHVVSLYNYKQVHTAEVLRPRCWKQFIYGVLTLSEQTIPTHKVFKYTQWFHCLSTGGLNPSLLVSSQAVWGAM